MRQDWRHRCEFAYQLFAVNFILVSDERDLKMKQWDEIDASLTTNLYLYGTEQPPSDLNARLRDLPLSGQTNLVIDAFSFMTLGAGRYANPARSELVTLFFQNASAADPQASLLDRLSQLYPTVTDGIYTTE